MSINFRVTQNTCFFFFNPKHRYLLRPYAKQSNKQVSNSLTSSSASFWARCTPEAFPKLILFFTPSTVLSFPLTEHLSSLSFPLVHLCKILPYFSSFWLSSSICLVSFVADTVTDRLLLPRVSLVSVLPIYRRDPPLLHSHPFERQEEAAKVGLALKRSSKREWDEGL